MSELEPRPAANTEGIDWRRLEVAIGRFSEHITTGIDHACTEQREIDHQTARCIAHALGRGYGRSSHLAEFGRSGEGNYLDLREEYLGLYNDPSISPVAKELIDWLGTHLVQRENTGSERRFMNEYLPPKLERILVHTTVTLAGESFIVHVPASYGSEAIADLVETLELLQLPEDAALQAFLGLPDVNAMSGDIMESFHEQYVATFTSIEEAVGELAEVDELERDVHDYAEQRHLFVEGITPDYEALRETAENGYDFVEWEGRVYVFYK